MADSSVAITAGSGTPIRVLTGLGAGSADQQVVTLADSAGNLLGTATAGVPVQSAFLEASGSASADNTSIISVDAAGYRWVSVHVTAVGSGFILFQGSNDNTNWRDCYLARADTNTAEPTFFAGGASLFAGNLAYRYFRCRTNSWTSGTDSVVAHFATDPGVVPSSPIRVAAFNSTSTSDGATLTAAFNVRALNDIYNGSNYDRWRSFGTLGAAGVTPVAGTSGGWTPYLKTALSNTKQQIKGSAGQLGGYMIGNPGAAWSYVQIFDAPSASVTVGTTTPTLSLPIPPGGAANAFSDCGTTFASGITIAATTTEAGSAAPSTALTFNGFYK